MTKNIIEAKVKIHKVGDKTTAIDPITKAPRQFTFKSSRIVKDDDDNIIGVVTEWQ